MNKYTSFNLMALAQVRSFGELLELVAKTPYHDIIKPFAPKEEDGEEGQIDYAGCELKLRTYYFRRLLESSESFGGESARKLRDIIGAQIDFINIINSYRMTVYFNAEADEIRERMIPIYLHIPEKKMYDLYAARDKEEFIKLLAETRYGREFTENGLDVNSHETAVVQLRYIRTKRFFSMARGAPECFYTFNTLREIELKNIIMIIEGIRYSLPAKEIGELLIV